LSIVSITFLRYILFHFLSASYMVFEGFLRTLLLLYMEAFFFRKLTG
jgi:hypothetical protein